MNYDFVLAHAITGAKRSGKEREQIINMSNANGTTGDGYILIRTI